MHVAPTKTAAVDGLVSVGGDEQTVGSATQPDEQAQSVGVEVLGFVDLYGLVDRGVVQFLEAFDGTTPQLMPGFQSFVS